MPEGTQAAQPSAALPTAARAPDPGTEPVHWFIYYRVAASDLARAQAVVAGFQKAMACQWPGLTCRLLRRPGAVDGLVTLMEIYEPAGSVAAAGASAPAALTETPGRSQVSLAASGGPTRSGRSGGALQAELAAGPEALADCLRGGRHVEVFTPCA